MKSTVRRRNKRLKHDDTWLNTALSAAIHCTYCGMASASYHDDNHDSALSWNVLPHGLFFDELWLYSSMLECSSRPLPRGQHSREVDVEPVGGVGQRLAHALRLGHGRKEREGALLVGVVQRGEVFGVVQGEHDRFRVKR